MLLIDVAFVQARPRPWRQAVDLANMMLCLALRIQPASRSTSGPWRQFTVEEITEGFAAARGLALPSQLRRMLRAQGRDLHAEFVRLLPTPPQPVVDPALEPPPGRAASSRAALGGVRRRAPRQQRKQRRSP